MKKQNLELKHYCSDFNKIRVVLKKIGAKKEKVKMQKDYFFELPNDKNKICPRLKFRVENNKPKEFIYYQRPDFTSKINALSEVVLYSAVDMKLFDFLNKILGIKAVVEKRREVWRKNNTVFYLDTVKGVGNIFEVELQKNGVITNKDRIIFESYKKELIPFLGGVIKGSNVDLVLKKN